MRISYLFGNLLEVYTEPTEFEELVRLVEDQNTSFRKPPSKVLVSQVSHESRRGRDEYRAAVAGELSDVSGIIGYDHSGLLHRRGVCQYLLCLDVGLVGEISSRRDDDDRKVFEYFFISLRVREDPAQGRDQEPERLSVSGLGLDKRVFSGQQRLDAHGLRLGQVFEPIDFL